MSEIVINPLIKLKDKAQYEQYRVILPEEVTYEDKRQVVNQRFSYAPFAIAMCEKVEHVMHAICFCREHNVSIRIRSGGHHHEGMSAANNVLIIDLTGIKDISYHEDEGAAWIPAGRNLKSVYQELEKKGYVLPGGVCDSVHVGGLITGGGWGVSTRKWGLACDNILAAEIVLADGRKVEASKDNEPALFKAIRGGGGGNFGIITKYKFILRKLGEEVTRFVLTYNSRDTKLAAIKWAKMQCNLNADSSLTVGGRIFVTQNAPLIILGGFYYGSQQQAETAIADLLENPKPSKVEYSTTRPPTPNKLLFGADLAAAHIPDSDSVASFFSSLAEVINPSFPASSEMYLQAQEQNNLPPQPRDTCNGRYANKVSSAFPKNKEPAVVEKLMTKAVDYIQRTPYRADLNNYVSIHGMGGQVQEEPDGGSAFPYRDRPFILKFQAWWDLSGEKKVDAERSSKYVKWIQDFRLALKDEIDGAFINFQDDSLVENSDTLSGRLELLQAYYGDRLEELRCIKGKYDPDYFFEFGMSIPPKKCEN